MGLIEDPSGYSPVSYQPDPSYGDRVKDRSDYATRSLDDFKADANRNVAEKSNLLGDKSSEEDSSQKAMNARANQIYQSQINQMMRGSDNSAAKRQIGLQSQSTANMQALYANHQSAAYLNWQQVSYQREAAIVAEATKRQLYSQLFSGLGSLAGGFAAKGLYNKNHASPTEAQGVQGGGGEFNYSGSATPVSFNSPTFGKIGGE